MHSNNHPAALTYQYSHPAELASKAKQYGLGNVDIGRDKRDEDWWVGAMVFPSEVYQSCVEKDAQVQYGGVAQGECSQWTMLTALDRCCSVSLHCDGVVYICMPLLDTDSEIDILTLPSFLRQADGYWGCVLVYSLRAI